MGEQAVREPVVYDFGVSSRLSREAVLGMRKIHAAAADELEFALSRAFGTEIKATSVEVSQVRYEAFVAMAPTGSYHAVMTSPGLGGQFQAALDPESTSRMLGLVFNAKVDSTGRELSIVDAKVLDSQFKGFVTVIDRNFNQYYALDLQFSRSMVSPKQIKIIDDAEPVVLVEGKFSIGVEKIDFRLLICYPQDVVTPVLVALSDIERASASEALTRTSPIQKSLMSVRLPVSVRLPSWSVDAGVIESMELGDVLRTGLPSNVSPVLSVAGRSLLNVNCFASGRRVAAEVLGIHQSGKADHE